MSAESFCLSTIGRVQINEIKSKIVNSPVEAGRIKTVFCHISQKTLLNLDLCMLLSPNKVVSLKGRLSSKCRKLIQESESCGLVIISPRKRVSQLSFRNMNELFLYGHQKRDQPQKYQYDKTHSVESVVSIIFLKTLGLFGSFLGFASFKHKEKHAYLRTACFSDNKKPLNSDNF